MYFVEHVFLAGDKFTENVKRKFRERFPNSVCPHLDTARDLTTKFRETGSVHDAPKTIDELKGEITNYVHSITRETLHKVFENKHKERISAYRNEDIFSNITCDNGK